MESRSGIDAFDPRSYWDERLRRNFGPGGVGCLGVSDDYNRWLSRMRAIAVRRGLRSVRARRRGMRVLDIGSGTGFWIERWRRLGAASVVGSDFSPEAVARLRGRWGAGTIHEFDVSADRVTLPGSFDAVSAIDVFFHIVEDAAYARAWHNVASLLRPGGLFVLTENLLRHRPERLAHLVSRTEADVVRQAGAAGFDVVDRRPVFVLMNRPIDSTWTPVHVWWRGIERLASRDDAGSITGAALFPLELVLTAILSEGPSTELLVCRKSGSRRRTSTTA